ncbi:hypothetical protein G6O69_16505 [Pseudenhygromyxa sp. WMMC2535]|uniref:hypothetical protein n=1 Tax=Pseudenhygromyxa sp. WMMC2535 TaxID=2712867 RepID=UPI00155320D0|nr:hypothetical protein [Pseudenhygromyxa sp. WMMC2535]NVB39445.1 hypothetical protein [Pseudenhygromyxa sp. WMMC2535]
MSPSLPRNFGLILPFALALACSSKEPTAKSTSSASPDAAPQTAAADPKALLDDYLAQTPAEAPRLSTEITGTPGALPDTDISRCQKTGWSYFECAQVFPDQGREWVRWECAHGDPPQHRAILCSRLAEYLHQGIGGPRQPELASALFDRQCQPDEANYYGSCFVAARVLMFDDPDRALEFARRGCSSETESPGGCSSLLPRLEAGLKSRKVIVEQVEGLAGVTVGSECAVWLWPTTPGSCGARLACGDLVLYGSEESSVPCKEDGTGGEDMTTAKDGDPAFRLEEGAVSLRDDDEGTLGAFSFEGRVE